MLAYLQDPTLAERAVSQFDSEQPSLETLHAVPCAGFLDVGWNTSRKLAMLKFFEDARNLPGGHSYAGYIENVLRDFFAGLTETERQAVLAGGAKWPTSALSVLASLPENPSRLTLSEIEVLDRKLVKVSGDPARRLRIGIAAVLASQPRCGRDELSPRAVRERTGPAGDAGNGAGPAAERRYWPYLVRSLSFVEGSAAQEILLKLALVRPEARRPGSLSAGDRGGHAGRKRQPGRDFTVGKVDRRAAQPAGRRLAGRPELLAAVVYRSLPRFARAAVALRNRWAIIGPTRSCSAT